MNIVNLFGGKFERNWSERMENRPNLTNNIIYLSETNFPLFAFIFRPCEDKFEVI